MSLELGSKEDCVFGYRPPLDRIEEIYCFYWVRVSFGHVYSNMQDWNVHGALKCIKPSEEIEIDGHEIYVPGDYVRLPTDQFYIDKMINWLKKDHDDNFENILNCEPERKGNFDSIELLSREVTHGCEFRTIEELKEHFLNNKNVSDSMKVFDCPKPA